MKKKLSLLVMLAVLVFGSSMTVNAQPKTMADGTVFDAEYYASTYADVKAAFGNDEKALYNHYLQYGKAEGRLACASEKTAGTTFAGSLTDNFELKNPPTFTNKELFFEVLILTFNSFLY